jgi:hypothetical protein
VDLSTLSRLSSFAFWENAGRDGRSRSRKRTVFCIALMVIAPRGRRKKLHIRNRPDEKETEKTALGK